MKKFSLLASVIACMTITPVLAGTTDSSAPYAGLGVGGYSGDLQVSGSGLSGSFGNNGLDPSGIVFGGYRWKLGQAGVAAEISYMSNVGKLASWGSSGVSISGNMNTAWAVSVLPDLNFSNDTTGFLRLGYTHVTGTLNGSNSNTSYSASASHDFNGILLGIGINQAISKNMTLRLEYQDMEMESWSDPRGVSWKPHSTGVNLGLALSF
jgi:opacity protein-like surface antigen